MPIDGMYGCVMTDAAVGLIRRNERERIVKTLEKERTILLPAVNEQEVWHLAIDHAIDIVRGTNAD